MTKIIISFRMFSNDSFSWEKYYQACHLSPHVSALGHTGPTSNCQTLHFFEGFLWPTESTLSGD